MTGNRGPSSISTPRAQNSVDYVAATLGQNLDILCLPPYSSRIKPKKNFKSLNCSSRPLLVIAS